MAISKKVINFLEKHNIKHEILEHKTVYTAFDAAQTMGEKISNITKTLALKVDKKYALVVIPADRRLDLEKLKKSLGVKKLSIVKEISIEKIFKIKTGKLLPFGTFHKVPVYVDNILLKSKAIIISSGTHTESLRLKAKDLLEHGGESIRSVSKVHKFKKPNPPAGGAKPAKKKKVVKPVKGWSASGGKPVKKVVKKATAKKRSVKKKVVKKSVKKTTKPARNATHSVAGGRK
jgi:Ala-tRNA(Pro) deacylase